MIGIIDYGVGNIGSVVNALNTLNVKSIVSNDPRKLAHACGFILPGDGMAAEGMKNLKKTMLDTFLFSEMQRNKPFLGICLGMQILLSFSDEGNVACLNVVKGKVTKLKTSYKIPQIGWNQVTISKQTKLFHRIKNDSYFYFVNSYICLPDEREIISGRTTYGSTFCSALEKNMIFGVQFHPEKSGETGLQMIKNFLGVTYEYNSSY